MAPRAGRDGRSFLSGAFRNSGLYVRFTPGDEIESSKSVRGSPKCTTRVGGGECGTQVGHRQFGVTYGNSCLSAPLPPKTSWWVRFAEAHSQPETHHQYSRRYEGALPRLILDWSQHRCRVQQRYRDSKREVELTVANVRVLPLTRRQLMSVSEFDAFAQGLRKMLGIRSRKVDSEWAYRRDELRGRLLAGWN